MATSETKRKQTKAQEPVSELQEQNNMLQKQLEDMKAQMEVMMKAMAQNQTVEQEPAKERNITFINMVPGTFVLKGSKTWEIVGQFKSKSFLEREARMIVNNMQNAISNGMLYIADAKFVKENELEEVYRQILSADQLKKLFNNPVNEFVEIYKSASDGQQQLIVNMIKSKKDNGEFVDANILVEIGKLCGENLLRYGEMSEED